MNKLKNFMHKLYEMLKKSVLITDEELEAYFESVEDDQYWIN